MMPTYSMLSNGTHRLEYSSQGTYSGRTQVCASEDSIKSAYTDPCRTSSRSFPCTSQVPCKSGPASAGLCMLYNPRLQTFGPGSLALPFRCTDSGSGISSSNQHTAMPRLREPRSHMSEIQLPRLFAGTKCVVGNPEVLRHDRNGR